MTTLALTGSVRKYLGDLQHATDPARSLTPPSFLVGEWTREQCQDHLERCRRLVAYMACWYAATAVCALRCALAGQQVQARQLEEAVLPDPVSVHRELTELSEPLTSPRYRPVLPQLGELRTGNDTWDAAMDQALRPLLEACTAVAEATRPTNKGPHVVDAAKEQAHRLPDLLIDYARAVHDALAAATCLQ